MLTTACMFRLRYIVLRDTVGATARPRARAAPEHARSTRNNTSKVP